MDASADQEAPWRFLDAHLNVYWLRPEAALWDTLASEVVSQIPMTSPSLDLGSGNGLFSFITAGGAFTADYDWYRNVNPAGFWEGHDIYDVFTRAPRREWIARSPAYRIDCALDAKANLLLQANGLGLYRHLIVSDADRGLPFPDEHFETVFSNMLYWLQSAERALAEVRRILRPGGRALLCIPDPRFTEYCLSYRHREFDSQVLRLLNRGRSESSRWTASYSWLKSLAAAAGLRVAHHTTYLSRLTLQIWDIGLRPLSPVLIKMTQRLSEPDRLAVKLEWIETTRPFLVELCELDCRTPGDKGFHFVCLERC